MLPHTVFRVVASHPWRYLSFPSSVKGDESSVESEEVAGDATGRSVCTSESAPSPHQHRARNSVWALFGAGTIHVSLLLEPEARGRGSPQDLQTERRDAPWDRSVEEVQVGFPSPQGRWYGMCHVLCQTVRQSGPSSHSPQSQPETQWQCHWTWVWRM